MARLWDVSPTLPAPWWPAQKVEATNIASNVRTVAKTNDSGDYILPFLIPGDYEVTLEMAGFERLARRATIEMSATVTVNATLVVGSASETVKVVAQADPMDVSSGSAGYVVDSQSITELPNKDGNVALLAMLSPGVMNTIPSGWSRPFDVSANLSPGVQGVAQGSNQYSLDGSPNMASNYNSYVPPPGVVEELKVQTATFDASYGFTPGATINMSLKSGTNALHGQAYDFLQNPLLNANSFFSNKAGQPRGVFRLNRWGINANGPVEIPKLYNGKNKTFWMYGYEGIHSTDPRGNLSTAVPTAAENNGDFSADLNIGKQYQIYDPATIRATSGGHTTCSPFPGNIIPTSRINPTARNIANFYSAPNTLGAADDSDNYFTTGPEWDHYYNHIFRIDHNFSEKNRMFVRGDVTGRDQNFGYLFNGADGDNLLQHNRGAAIDDVYIISPQFLLNTRYSYTRFLYFQHPLQLGMDLTALGFSPQFVQQAEAQGPLGYRLPIINISGYAALSVSQGSAVNPTSSITIRTIWE
ncbi:MAG TPA: carboxypeptidase-like regulatory domain-containing protein [Bryobacteraceae bacterium]